MLVPMMQIRIVRVRVFGGFVFMRMNMTGYRRQIGVAMPMMPVVVRVNVCVRVRRVAMRVGMLAREH